MDVAEVTNVYEAGSRDVGDVDKEEMWIKKIVKIADKGVESEGILFTTSPCLGFSVHSLRGFRLLAVEIGLHNDFAQ